MALRDNLNLVEQASRICKKLEDLIFGAEDMGITDQDRNEKE
jgi:hypothetical protein